MIKFICLIKPLKICLITVLGQLPPRKIAPNPKTNSNPNPNPDPGRGGGRGAIFFRGNCPNTSNYIPHETIICDDIGPPSIN